MVITKIKFGSHLYGTSTPESDTDYKSVYVPEARIKRGKLPYAVVAHEIELLLEAVEDSAKTSTLRDEPDQKFIDDLVAYGVR